MPRGAITSKPRRIQQQESQLRNFAEREPVFHSVRTAKPVRGAAVARPQKSWRKCEAPKPMSWHLNRRWSSAIIEDGDMTVIDVKCEGF